MIPGTDANAIEDALINADMNPNLMSWRMREMFTEVMKYCILKECHPCIFYASPLMHWEDEQKWSTSKYVKCEVWNDPRIKSKNASLREIKNMDVEMLKAKVVRYLMSISLKVVKEAALFWDSFNLSAIRSLILFILTALSCLCPGIRPGIA